MPTASLPAMSRGLVSHALWQVFWLSLVGAIGSGLIGLLLSRYIRIPLGGGRSLDFGPGGTIVVCTFS